MSTQLRDPQLSRHPLIVVGAGPAGTAAALHFLRRRPGAAVLLLDKAAFPRDKVCGDAISPDGVAELERLGARSVVDGYAPIDRIRVRSVGGIQVSGASPVPGYVVPRAVLDARLVELAVAAGAELRQVKVRTVEQDGDAVRVDGRCEGAREGARGDAPGDRGDAPGDRGDAPGDRGDAPGDHGDAPEHFEAPVIVAADGANSAVRRRLGVPPNSTGHVGIALRGYARREGEEAELFLGWVAAGGPAYAWSFPVDERVRNVGFGMLASRNASRARLEEELGHNLEPVAPDPATLKAHHLPMSSGRPCPYHGRVLLAGDAASLVNPLTGEGIFYALLSGRLAAQAALDAPQDPGPRYAALLRRALGRHFRHTALLARAAAHPGAIDAVVAAARDPAVLQTVGDLAFGKGAVTPRMVAHIAAGWLRQRRR